MHFNVLKTVLTILLSSASLLCATADVAEAPLIYKESLKRLITGNERYTRDALVHPNRSQARREALSELQAPFAIVVGCSDSRVSPVIIFDQGIGDLFEVRIAGNVVGPIEIASVEYSAKFLGSSLIFVLGHENCGAVNAVLKNQTQDIEPIAEKIREAIKANPELSNNPLESAIKANVHSVVKQLRTNPLIAQLIKEKKLEVVGGYYHLESGKVELCCDLQENQKKTQRNE